MVLNRRKFAKNTADLIRRKFSIDAGLPVFWRLEAAKSGASTISKPYRAGFRSRARP
jgi:hypothetical protein